jgi:hypothetical protein
VIDRLRLLPHQRVIMSEARFAIRAEVMLLPADLDVSEAARHFEVRLGIERHRAIRNQWASRLAVPPDVCLAAAPGVFSDRFLGHRLSEKEGKIRRKSLSEKRG